MAVDMFLKLDGVVGESQDDTHRGEIDVLAWSWGASHSGTTHMGVGSGGGKVNVQDLSFTKYIDSATHTLWQKLFNGDHVATGELVIRKAGGAKSLEYLKIKFIDLIISSISTGGSGGEDRLTENVTLNFGAVELTYVPQKADGSPCGRQQASLDIASTSNWST